MKRLIWVVIVIIIAAALLTGTEIGTILSDLVDVLRNAVNQLARLVVSLTA